MVPSEGAGKTEWRGLVDHLPTIAAVYGGLGPLLSCRQPGSTPPNTPILFIEPIHPNPVGLGMSRQLKYVKQNSAIVTAAGRGLGVVENVKVG